jgi:hypothetical protein
MKLQPDFFKHARFPLSGAEIIISVLDNATPSALYGNWVAFLSVCLGPAAKGWKRQNWVESGHQDENPINPGTMLCHQAEPTTGSLYRTWDKAASQIS